ncbi:MAG: type II secretion system F family protein [Pseudomonadota bacterium]
MADKDTLYYKYQGRDKNSQLKTGVLTAGNKQGAMVMARAFVAVLLSLEEINAEQAAILERKYSTRKKGSLLAQWFPYRPSLATKAFIFFQLAAMLEAGLDLMPALEALGEEMEDARAQQMFFGISKSIQEGKDLSQALAEYPRIFEEVIVNVVAVGEASGQLDTVLKSISFQMDRLHEVRGNVIGALAYPAITLVVAFGMVLVMLLKVLPMFEAIYAEFGSKLPLITRSLIAVSHTIRDHFILCGIGVALVIFVANWLWGIPKYREKMEQFVYRIPIFGSLIEEYIYVQISRTFGLLIRSGIHVLQALQHTAMATPWITYRNRIITTKEGVAEGEMISAQFKKYKVLPPIANQLLTAGEHTGTIDDMLDKIAAFYDRKVMNKVKILSSLIEPLMIVFLGALIGVLLVAMYMPIFMLGKAMKGH